MVSEMLVRHQMYLRTSNAAMRAIRTRRSSDDRRRRHSTPSHPAGETESHKTELGTRLTGGMATLRQLDNTALDIALRHG